MTACVGFPSKEEKEEEKRTIDLTKMGEAELKAMAYDVLRVLDKNKQILSVVESELKHRFGENV